MTNTWEIIVVGSGMGGMVAAAALSKLGHQVLLLEKYGKLGGQTHSFTREGFTWDAGIHYLGGLAPGGPENALLEWISDQPIQFAPIGSVYDTLHIGDHQPLQLSRPTAAQKLDLLDRFPEEAGAIAAWFEAIEEAVDAMKAVGQIRGLPAMFGSAIKWWKGRAIDRWCRRTTSEVINEITTNPLLANVLAAQWGDFGGRPSTASFAIHAAVIHSYLEKGAFYPVGGASSISEKLLPTIETHGGQARAGVEVTSLVMDGDQVVGVETSDREKLIAEKVVSDIGAWETVDRLLPEQHAPQEWVDEIRSIGSNICHFSLFLGFAGDVEAAGMTKSNHWLYPDGNVDAIWTNAPEGTPPSMFVSFGSLKDPEHDPGPEKKYAGEVIAWADWSSVEPFANIPPDQRGEGYQAFKKKIRETLLEQFTRYFPQLAKLIVFREVATPLATAAITGHRRGAFYGLDVTPQRITCDALKPKTPVDGLYLTGQDVMSPGIPGALWGGILAAGSIDPKVYTHLG